MNTDLELNTAEAENDIFALYSGSPHDSPTEDQIFEVRSALEEVRGCEASLNTFKGMQQSPSEWNGLKLPNKISGKKATMKQTETEERHFGVQPNTEHSINTSHLPNEPTWTAYNGLPLLCQINGITVTVGQTETEERHFDDQPIPGHSRNMTQPQNESSEDHEGCQRLKSQTNGETDTDSPNEVEERASDAEVVNEFTRPKPSLEADNTNYGKFYGENSEIYYTVQGYNISHDVLTETGGGSVHKEGAFIQPNTIIQESGVIPLKQSGISVPSKHTFESTGGKSGYNDSSFIQPEISAPSTYTPTSCGGTTDNLVSDDQHEMTNRLGRYSRDLSQEIKVGTKRKNSEKDTLNKKCKGKTSKLSEAEKKRKNADKAKLNRQKKNLELASLKKLVETLQKTNLEKDRIIRSLNFEKDLIMSNLTQNPEVSDNCPNNSPSDRNELDEEEFTEMIHQAEVEAYDPEKFLKILNNWFRSKGVSEINGKEPAVGVVRVGRVERMMKIRVLKHYQKRKSDKEGNKKFRDDLERNGLT